MKKSILLILIFVISINLFANPLPANEDYNNQIFGILSILTLGIGYLVYKSIDEKNSPPIVDFVNEEINIEVNDLNEVSVEGIYNFKRNKKNIDNFEILYPFPKSKKYGEIKIDYVKINGEEVKYKSFGLKGYNKISILLYFNNSDDCNLQIKFTQFPNNSAYKYILKSTRKWKKVLKESVINVSLPNNSNIKSNFIELTRDVTVGKDQQTYKMVKTDFYPNRDLEFEW